MTDNVVLENLKEYLLENVSKKIKLKKPPDNDEGDTSNYELVNPAVYIGWVPPKNYLDEFGYDVPGLVIMEDGGLDDGTEASLDIRIGIATYDPGITTSDGAIKPNTSGYRDVLNIATLIRTELAKQFVIGEIFTVGKPIKWGLYEEQKYPYWHGWISFTVSVLPINYDTHGIEKYL